MADTDWKSFLTAGDSYLRIASRGSLKTMVLTDSLVYHMLGLSLESYLMALFRLHNQLPCHSTLSSMVTEAGGLMEIPQDLCEEIKAMDRMLNLCDPAAPLEMALSREGLAAMLAAGEKMGELVHRHVEEGAAA